MHTNNECLYLLFYFEVFLAANIKISNFTVITLRKPTHAGGFQSLRETYFFSHQGVEQGTA